MSPVEMTRDQYSVWLKDFGSRFPDAGQWATSHPAIVDLWFTECLGHIELNDVLQANREIFAGRRDRWDDFRREMIGSIVARHARSVAHDRAKLKQRREAARADSRKYQRPAILGELLDATGGGPHRQAMELCRQWQREGVAYKERLRRLEEILP
jgi:hypothetical protein